MSNVKRIYVQKKEGFDIEAKGLYEDLVQTLNPKGLENVRIINRYDIEGIDEFTYEKARYTIFAESTVDNAYDENIRLPENCSFFAVEYLPGQYDQRADSAAQCVQILSKKDKPIVKSAKLIVLEGQISDEDLNKIKNYCINPVDSREAELEKPENLTTEMQMPPDVQIMDKFITMSEPELEEFRTKMQFAMSNDDIKFVQKYFKEDENRNPTITELKVIDTYWSDHCRHTTFLTEITEVQFDEGKYAGIIQDAYGEYLKIREEIYKDKQKPISLMDMAVAGMKYLKMQGKLQDLDESEEINACSIRVKADISGKEEEWLVMFKNETHNHPTEIEPFGGAATCLGGAIRDPLSGRTYVYQAMRVTGSGDPRTKIEDTLPGKLPQRKITTEAAHGYSSYGNQIGLSTGQVSEVYDEGFVAKRMEVGAVIAAAPKGNIVRVKPQKGDCVILVGGRTGRDGCGGATGSSKEHSEESILTCGPEVQKGNPPTERNIQRLFRRKEAAVLIKKCNDFGAGGVAVAVGELADSLEVNLDLILKKYEGLDGTELAISESQERMAVVVSKDDTDKFIKYADEENLEAVNIAKITDDGRFKMLWRGKYILDLSRDFLNTNGVQQRMKVNVKEPLEEESYFKQSIKLQGTVKDLWLENIQDLNIASQKGLVERFDSTIGAGTILMPLGGRYQLTPAEGMAAKLPVLEGDTTTATLMTYGYNPKISKWSPFHGALYAVVESAAKITAMGGDYSSIRLSFQEYFEKLGQDPRRWGKPFSALLGALKAQKELEIPAIGGKDSMSGTFMDLDVPPTLISFAVNTANVKDIISPEFKKCGSRIIYVYTGRDDNEIIDFEEFKINMNKIHELIKKGKILSAKTVGHGGIAAAISKMAAGNKIGAEIDGLLKNEIFEPAYGSMLLEVAAGENIFDLFKEVNYRVIGNTISEECIRVSGDVIDLNLLIEKWSEPLEGIFPTRDKAFEGISISEKIVKSEEKIRRPIKGSIRIAKPKVLIPFFPGTNCEVDSLRAFEKAGADVKTLMFRNITSNAIEDSIKQFAKDIKNSQIVMIPGGFSGGDEPDGSAKFITSVFRNPEISDVIMDLIKNRDGLMLGICNGFQALIKLGLVPYGEIRDIHEEDPTLTYNRIGRHVSCLVRTKITSVKTPWFNNVDLGDIHTLPVSHGEGRFVISEKLLQELEENGQIATRYVDFDGRSAYDIAFNPNGSVAAVEGIISPDGRILGKMAHSERIGENLYKNVPGDMDQKIFEAGVEYYL
ncbi:MAG: phosphoribosylformylglycinamidine synthase [Clostridiales bacterium]|nr:phosphoribosylformylglycinamidine synthase [Clostridiales bacterium]